MEKLGLEIIDLRVMNDTHNHERLDESPKKIIENEKGQGQNHISLIF